LLNLKGEGRVLVESGVPFDGVSSDAVLAEEILDKLLLDTTLGNAVSGGGEVLPFRAGGEGGLPKPEGGAACIGVAGVMDPRLHEVALSDLVGPGVTGLLYPDRLLHELAGVDDKLLRLGECAAVFPREVPPLIMVVDP
jgi:hypothetical protein